MAPIPALNLVRPTNEKRTVGRKANSQYRTREHLTEREVERLIEAARDNRYGHRDATMLLLAFRHGLRVSELVDLRWEQIDLKGGVLHVRKVNRVVRRRILSPGANFAPCGGLSGRQMAPPSSL